MIENMSIYFNDRNTTQIIIDKKSKDDFQMELNAGSDGDYLFHFSRDQLEKIRNEINKNLVDDNFDIREVQDYKEETEKSYTTKEI
ncbi:MAG: hypothetical protein A2163_04065 [Actinobacteria bacterium RBG_13_35_12]|nr:MAG: hypothetical protein A2163_04065 [Actinobacteria bacterium RBG_13_35_12]